jgi:hypothetical protein
MSQATSGTSINFDAQALHDADEAEYHREEKEREHEVKGIIISFVYGQDTISSPRT